MGYLRSRSSLTIVALLVCLSQLGLARVISNVAEGQLICQGSPMVNMSVLLYEEAGSLIGMATTDKTGRFSISTTITAPWNSQPYIQIVYKTNCGMNRLVITNSLKISRSENFKPANITSAGQIQFGTVNLKTQYCKPYRIFRDVLNEFIEITGRSHPQSTIYVIADAWLSTTFWPLPFPFASTDTIRFPADSAEWLDFSTARHELGHTIRQSLDGGFIHSLWDAFKYNYVRSHWCAKLTNPQMAFNEGWAEFWSETAKNKSCRAIGDDTSLSYEGRVTWELKKLSIRCHQSIIAGKKNFVAVLAENPLKIHTYNEFLNAHDKRFGCR